MGNQNDERSPSGQPILRHKAEQRGWTPPAETTGAAEVERHMAQYFGEASTVFHELVSDLIHLDVHIIRPRAGRNHWTLFTTGMSDLPMTAPEAAQDDKWAELMLSLPADSPIDRLQVTPPPSSVEQWYWPIRWLKQLARLPHEYKTFRT